jgi:hypothetical protein
MPRPMTDDPLVATPALELPLHVIQPARQTFDGSGDVVNIIAGYSSCLVGRRRRRQASIPSGIRAVWQAITLVAEAESVPESKVVHPSSGSRHREDAFCARMEGQGLRPLFACSYVLL